MMTFGSLKSGSPLFQHVAYPVSRRPSIRGWEVNPVPDNQQAYGSMIHPWMCLRQPLFLSSLFFLFLFSSFFGRSGFFRHSVTLARHPELIMI